MVHVEDKEQTHSSEQEDGDGTQLEYSECWIERVWQNRIHRQIPDHLQGFHQVPDLQTEEMQQLLFIYLSSLG